MREDVEALASLSVSPILASKRPDLISPFQGDRTNESMSRPVQRTVRPSLATEGAAVVPLAVAYQLESTLSPDAKRILTEMRGDTDPVQTRAHSSKSRRSGGVHAKVTAESLYAGAKLARNLIQSSEVARKEQKRDDA
jgi:hypothetical protein